MCASPGPTAQEVHKGWISHLQPRPWLSAGRQLFPSPWHRQALPLPIHLIKTTSLLWGSHVLHPSWAASFPESHARACRDQILSGAGAEGQGFSPLLPSVLDKPAWGGWLRGL